MYKQYLTYALKAARAAHRRHGVREALCAFRETDVPLSGEDQHLRVDQVDAYLFVRLTHEMPLEEEGRTREFDEALVRICIATGIDIETILK